MTDIDLPSDAEQTDPAPSRSPVRNPDPVERHLLVPVATEAGCWLIDPDGQRRARRFSADDTALVDAVVEICERNPTIVHQALSELDHLERTWPDCGFAALRERVVATVSGQS